MPERFEDAIKALRHIARGNGNVMRIADRIVAAHERETKVEGVCGPITGELRAAMRQWGWIESDGSITFATSPTPPSVDAEQSLAISGSDFDRHCDAIDSVHAQLERENKDLRMKFVNANRHALHMERENESLKAELDRVLGEQEDKALTYEEAEQLCRRAFDGGATYGSESMRYGVNARAYDWEHWLEKHESLFTAKPTDTWESVIYDAMQAGRTDASVDVTPLIERCKALAGEDR